MKIELESAYADLCRQLVESLMHTFHNPRNTEEIEVVVKIAESS